MMRTKDRRFIKTEKVIVNSMINLLCSGYAGSLLIDDLVQDADINKSTFYLHYQSLDQLISAIEDEVVAALASISSNLLALPLAVFLEETLVWVSKNKKLCRAAFAACSYRFNEKLELLYKQYLLPVKMSKNGRIIDVNELTETALIQSLISIVRSWINEGCKFPIENIVNLLTSILSSKCYYSVYQ